MTEGRGALEAARETEQLATAVRANLEAREGFSDPEDRQQAARLAAEKAIELIFSATFTFARTLLVGDPRPVRFGCGCTYHPEPDVDAIAPWLEQCPLHQHAREMWLTLAETVEVHDTWHQYAPVSTDPLTRAIERCRVVLEKTKGSSHEPRSVELN